MTQIVFELGEHPQETGVYVNPDVRWTLIDIAKEIIKLGEEEFTKRYCYYETKSSNIANENFQVFNTPESYKVVSATIRKKEDCTSNNQENSSTSRKAKYTVKVGNKTLCQFASKVEMVYQVLSFLIEQDGYDVNDIIEKCKGRYFKKFALLKQFPRRFDHEEMKKALGQDETRYTTKRVIESDGFKWIPCTQWIPENTSLFIRDMSKMSEELSIIES